MLSLTPVSLSEANAFVARCHRHHKPVVGHKFSIGCMADGRLVGVAIVGRPVSRYLDNGLTLEVNRLCTDGTKNACSFLYAAAWRAARAMGYRKIVTYILDTESGAMAGGAGYGLSENRHLHSRHGKRCKPAGRRMEMRGAGWRQTLDRKPPPCR